jgi:hypothetical protein
MINEKLTNKKLTECKEIDFFCNILENLNFFNNDISIIEKNIFNKIGLTYTMNFLVDTKTNDMLSDDIWDGENFSEDAKFVIATYILDNFKQNILNNVKQT